MTTAGRPDTPLGRAANRLLGLDDGRPEAARADALRRLRDADFVPDPAVFTALSVRSGRTRGADPLRAAEEARLRAEVEAFAFGFFDHPVGPRRDRWRDLARACEGHDTLKGRLLALAAALEVDRDAFDDRSPAVVRLANDLFFLFVLRPAPRAEQTRALARAFRSDPKLTDPQRQRAVRDFCERYPEIAALDDGYLGRLVWPYRPLRPGPRRDRLGVLEAAGVKEPVARRIGFLNMKVLVPLVLGVMLIKTGERLIRDEFFAHAPAAATANASDPDSVQARLTRFMNRPKDRASNADWGERFADDFKEPLRRELANAGVTVGDDALKRVVDDLPDFEIASRGDLGFLARTGLWSRANHERFAAELAQSLSRSGLPLSKAQADAVARAAVPQGSRLPRFVNTYKVPLRRALSQFGEPHDDRTLEAVMDALRGEAEDDPVDPKTLAALGIFTRFDSLVWTERLSAALLKARPGLPPEQAAWVALAVIPNPPSSSEGMGNRLTDGFKEPLRRALVELGVTPEDDDLQQVVDHLPHLGLVFRGGQPLLERFGAWNRSDYELCVAALELGLSLSRFHLTPEQIATAARKSVPVPPADAVDTFRFVDGFREPLRRALAGVGVTTDADTLRTLAATLTAPAGPLSGDERLVRQFTAWTRRDHDRAVGLLSQGLAATDLGLTAEQIETVARAAVPEGTPVAEEPIGRFADDFKEPLRRELAKVGIKTDEATLREVVNTVPDNEYFRGELERLVRFRGWSPQLRNHLVDALTTGLVKAELLLNAPQVAAVAKAAVPEVAAVNPGDALWTARLRTALARVGVTADNAAQRVVNAMSKETVSYFDDLPARVEQGGWTVSYQLACNRALEQALDAAGLRLSDEQVEEVISAVVPLNSGASKGAGDRLTDDFYEPLRRELAKVGVQDDAEAVSALDALIWEGVVFRGDLRSLVALGGWTRLDREFCADQLRRVLRFNLRALTAEQIATAVDRALPPPSPDADAAAVLHFSDGFIAPLRRALQKFDLYADDATLRTLAATLTGPDGPFPGDPRLLTHFTAWTKRDQARAVGRLSRGLAKAGLKLAPERIEDVARAAIPEGVEATPKEEMNEPGPRDGPPTAEVGTTDAAGPVAQGTGLFENDLREPLRRALAHRGLAPEEETLREIADRGDEVSHGLLGVLVRSGAWTRDDGAAARVGLRRALAESGLLLTDAEAHDVAREAVPGPTYPAAGAFVDGFKESFRRTLVRNGLRVDVDAAVNDLELALPYDLTLQTGTLRGRVESGAWTRRDRDRVASAVRRLLSGLPLALTPARLDALADEAVPGPLDVSEEPANRFTEGLKHPLRRELAKLGVTLDADAVQAVVDALPHRGAAFRGDLGVLVQFGAWTRADRTFCVDALADALEAVKTGVPRHQLYAAVQAAVPAAPPGHEWAVNRFIEGLKRPLRRELAKFGVEPDDDTLRSVVDGLWIETGPLPGDQSFLFEAAGLTRSDRDRCVGRLRRALAGADLGLTDDQTALAAEAAVPEAGDDDGSTNAFLKSFEGPLRRELERAGVAADPEQVRAAVAALPRRGVAFRGDPEVIRRFGAWTRFEHEFCAAALADGLAASGLSITPERAAAVARAAVPQPAGEPVDHFTAGFRRPLRRELAKLGVSVDDATLDALVAPLSPASGSLNGDQRLLMQCGDWTRRSHARAADRLARSLGSSGLPLTPAQIDLVARAAVPEPAPPGLPPAPDLARNPNPRGAP